MKSEESVVEIRMKEMTILCNDIIDDNYLKTQDARKIVDLLCEGLEKIKELRVSRDKAIIRRDTAEKELKMAKNISTNQGNNNG